MNSLIYEKEKYILVIGKVRRIFSKFTLNILQQIGEEKLAWSINCPIRRISGYRFYKYISNHL